MYNNSCKKALTFSFDDGIQYDKRLVELFNKYGMKCTFNLNSGIMTRANNWIEKNIMVFRMNQTEIGDLYKGHEIASHTLTHPYLPKLDYETQRNEILTDKNNLERMFHTKIKGLALPYGNYDENTLKVLKECDLKWCRLCGTTMKFDMPKNLPLFSGTCHFMNKDIFKLAEQFISLNPEEDSVFYIWGHSYELESNDYWETFEKLLKMLANRDDIYYATNSESFHIE